MQDTFTYISDSREKWVEPRTNPGCLLAIDPFNYPSGIEDIAAIKFSVIRPIINLTQDSIDLVFNIASAKAPIKGVALTKYPLTPEDRLSWVTYSKDGLNLYSPSSEDWVNFVSCWKLMGLYTNPTPLLIFETFSIRLFSNMSIGAYAKKYSSELKSLPFSPVSIMELPKFIRSLVSSSLSNSVKEGHFNLLTKQYILSSRDLVYLIKHLHAEKI